MAIVAGARILKAILDKKKKQCGYDSTGVPPPTPPRREKFVTLVGRASAGKSSLGNALLGRREFRTGITHGTTTAVQSAEHPDGYTLQDTPGLLDVVDHTGTIWGTLPKSSIVVYVTPGQLYRQEVEFVEQIATRQKRWDVIDRLPVPRELLVFVNFADRKQATMPSSDRLREMDAICSQVSSWISPAAVRFGAADPFSQDDDAKPDVEDLKALIRSQLLF
jgi:hypothetical protein